MANVHELRLRLRIGCMQVVPIGTMCCKGNELVAVAVHSVRHVCTGSELAWRPPPCSDNKQRRSRRSIPEGLRVGIRRTLCRALNRRMRADTSHPCAAACPMLLAHRECMCCSLRYRSPARATFRGCAPARGLDKACAVRAMACPGRVSPEPPSTIHALTQTARRTCDGTC
jgi:hypothetical protein